MRRPKAFFYVQHLLGIGHLVRATRVARAMAREAFDVDLVIGGAPVPGLDVGAARLVQLQPLRSAVDFGELIDADGHAIDEAAKTARRDRLLAAFDDARPDVLLVEAFPFGRSQMRFELLPLLARARTAVRRPLVGVSIRDILQRGRKPQRLEETAKIVEQYVDVVLVHGDPRLVRLEATFPLAGRIEDRIVYTGMVGPDADSAPPLGMHEVIVSAGGGAVGERLIRAAIEARPLTSLRDAPWLIVAGPNFPILPGGDRRGLAEGAAGIEVVAFVADLPRRLRSARLSISQAGYNTVADILVAGCRAVLVPYAAFGESEQTDRARMMEARGVATIVDEAECDAVRLAAAVERALALPEPTSDVALDGAYRTTEILRETLTRRTDQGEGRSRVPSSVRTGSTMD